MTKIDFQGFSGVVYICAKKERTLMTHLYNGLACITSICNMCISRYLVFLMKFKVGAYFDFTHYHAQDNKIQLLRELGSRVYLNLVVQG